MTFYHLWIWQNKTGIDSSVVSWCSQESCGVIKTDLRHSTRLSRYLKPASTSELRDGEASLALMDLVGNEITNTISSWIINQPAHTLCINLIHTLPEIWQKLPFEWCQHNGQLLSEYVQIIRYAPLPKKAFAQGMEKASTLLNLWPQAEQKKIVALLSSFSHSPRGRLKCLLHLQKNDISNQSMLCVFAHGNEQDNKKPLLSECKQQAWALPSQQLPPLVVILACGGEQGNLRDYAVKLLQEKPDQHGVRTAYGAKTVLVAQGKLDLERAVFFIQAFIKKWQVGQPVNQILYQLQQADNAEHAAKRMQIIGQSDLRQLIFEKNNQSTVSLTWEELKVNARTDDHALIMLLNCLTRHFIVKYFSVESIIEVFYTILGLPYNAPEEKKELVYDSLQRIYVDCDDLTKAWLSYFLRYLSSMHNHNKTSFYEREANRLEAIPLLGRELFIFHAAQTKYRERNHVKAMQMVVQGFNLVLQHKETCKEVHYKLAKLTTNLCIDIAFTDIGFYFLRNAHKCIHSRTVDSDQNLIEAFTQLDLEARLSARNGDPDNEEDGEAGLNKCIRKLSIKRHKALSMGYKGRRELSLLLIFSSWIKSPDKAYINEALNTLHEVEDITSALRKKTGNVTELYLLKGLANWAWQQQDKEAMQLLEQYKSILVRLCYQFDDQDAGPLGSIIACMCLMQQDDPILKQAWNAIADKMHGQFHYFELTIFNALLNKEKKAAVFYKEFREQQQMILNELKQLKTDILDTDFYDLINKTEMELYKQPMNDDKTRFSCDLDLIRRWGLVPF